MMLPTSIVDLSQRIEERMPVYPGDEPFTMRSTCSHALSPRMTISVHQLSLGTHLGTHIDAPYHFFPDRDKISDLPLEHFVGRAVVLDVRHVGKAGRRIEWADIEVAHNRASLEQIGARTDDKADIVLLWTGWDVHWDTPMYDRHPYFSRGVAMRLRDMGARVVGVDTMSVDGQETGFAMHEELLGAGRLICENMRGIGGLVSGAGEGEGEIWASMVPLNVHGSDGSPVRAYGWTQPVRG